MCCQEFNKQVTQQYSYSKIIISKRWAWLVGYAEESRYIKDWLNGEIYRLETMLV